MTFVLVVFVIYAVALLLVRVTNFNIAYLFAPAVFLIVGWEYAFGLMGVLNLAMEILVILVFGCLIYLLLKHRQFQFVVLKNVMSAGSLSFLLFSAVSYFKTKDWMLSQWDEFSHWGTTVKAMHQFALLGPANPAELWAAEYPPGLALFQYFVIDISPSWSEGLLFWSLHLLAISMIVVALAECTFRAPGELIFKLFCTLLAATAIFDILTQLAVPVLHVDLGIGNKFFTMLQDRCDYLDAYLKAAMCEVTCGEEPDEAFFDGLNTVLRAPSLILAQLFQKLRALKSKMTEDEAAKYLICLQEKNAVELNIAHLQHAMDNLKADGQADVAAELLSNLAEFVETRDKVTADLKRFDGNSKELQEIMKQIAAAPGPYRRRLLRVEKATGLKYEPYHGCSLAGNATHTFRDARVPFVAVLKPLRVHGHTGAANYVHDKFWAGFFLELLNKWTDMSRLYNRNSPLCRHEVAQLGLMAADLGMFFPMHFPHESITYKFHLLCFHIHEWALLHGPIGLSPGMCNEQGIESFHQRMALLIKRCSHAKKANGERQSKAFRLAVATQPKTVHGQSCPRVCPTCLAQIAGTVKCGCKLAHKAAAAVVAAAVAVAAAAAAAAAAQAAV